MTLQSIQYKKSLVAFLDILGFKEHFEKNSNNDHQELLELLTTFVKENRDGFHKKNEKNGDTIRPYITAFSDCIVLSCPLEEGWDNFYKNLHAILNAISIFSCRALYKNYFIRGALSIGDFYHKNGVVIGYPLIECVEHERKEPFPKITVTSTFIEEFKRFENEQKKTNICAPIERLDNFKIKIDFDNNSYYFDYMRTHDPLSRSPEDSKNSNTLQNIVSNLEEEIRIKQAINTMPMPINLTIDNRKSVVAKLIWIKNYINTYIEEYGLNLV